LWGIGKVSVVPKGVPILRFPGVGEKRTREIRNIGAHGASKNSWKRSPALENREKRRAKKPGKKFVREGKKKNPEKEGKER